MASEFPNRQYDGSTAGPEEVPIPRKLNYYSASGEILNALKAVAGVEVSEQRVLDLIAREDVVRIAPELVWFGASFGQSISELKCLATDKTTREIDKSPRISLTFPESHIGIAHLGIGRMASMEFQARDHTLTLAGSKFLEEKDRRNKVMIDGINLATALAVGLAKFESM